MAVRLRIGKTQKKFRGKLLVPLRKVLHAGDRFFEQFDHTIILPRKTHLVMPAHSRSKNGVASLAYVAGIHCCAVQPKDVDGRVKPGHDGG